MERTRIETIKSYKTRSIEIAVIKDGKDFMLVTRKKKGHCVVGKYHHCTMSEALELFEQLKAEIENNKSRGAEK